MLMQAVVLDRFGGPDVLHLDEVARPQPLPTEVLVRIEAAGVNAADWRTRSGRGFAAMMGNPPIIPGWDLAGVVTEVGAGVTIFVPGDRVFGMARFPHPGKAYAEYVTAPARHLARIPRGLSSIEASALPLAALTAWQSLVDTAAVETGQTVVICGASSDVGQFAVQIAKAHGADVVAIGSAPSRNRLLSLGADEVVADTELSDRGAWNNVDIVLDIDLDVHGTRRTRSWMTCLRPGGMFISPLTTPTCVHDERQDDAVRLTRIMAEPDHVALQQLAHLVSTGQLSLQIEHVLAFDKAAEAHQLGETDGFGKAILTMN
jgi:NADPH:quinone reductase-like Zn-dependent oxidoreductase